MKEQITICKQNPNGTLGAVAERKLSVELDEATMTLKAKFNGKWYTVSGNVYLQYIIAY
jgi:hypothetical protein